jgi:hypothetical protein
MNLVVSKKSGRKSLRMLGESVDERSWTTPTNGSNKLTIKVCGG